MKDKPSSNFILLISVMVLITVACGWQTQAIPTPVSRDLSIPPEATKIKAEDDPWQPIAAPGWSQPESLSPILNTPGGEDSPFLTPEWDLYFFFTPDVNIPAEEQVGDGVTGIWKSHRVNGSWTTPQQVLLAEPGEPHLDGCPFVIRDWMAFCSARAGNLRSIDIYTAELIDGAWTHVSNWGEPVNQAYRVGELHISSDGNLYFGSDRPGGVGGLDLWISKWEDSGWKEPANLGPIVNTSADENRPYITTDGQELWFDAPGRKGYPGPSIFRSLRQPDGTWGPPEEIISSFAGEPTLSADGNTLLFIHHYFDPDLGKMLEADIYFSERVGGTP